MINLPETWKTKTIILITGLIYLFALYNQTLISMIDIWYRSETFAHGFIIFPITLYLIWRARYQLTALNPQTSWSGALILVASGMLWLLANVTDIIVIQQFTFIAMIIGLTWLCMGIKIIKLLAFPLFFLFFAVPAGEFLVPSLIDFTAKFTVGAIRLTGIPVYAEGNFISLPSGDWSVVEACSGIRYLIASITLGFLYAYLTYNKLSKRIVFIILSFIVPIFANGARAFMIVMIGHFSGMKYAVGTDHLLYGWLFFGLVIFIMFWLGSFWADPIEPNDKSEISAKEIPATKQAGKTVALVLMIFVIAGIWPFWSYLARSGEVSAAELQFKIPDNVADWKHVSTLDIQWKPSYQNPSETFFKQHQLDGKSAGVYMLYYKTQGQDAELINTENKPVHTKDPVWSVNNQHTIQIDTGNYKTSIKEWRLKSRHRKLLVWRAYLIGESVVFNRFHAKLAESMDVLFKARHSGAAVMIYTEIKDDNELLARQTLGQYLKVLLPELQQAYIKAENNG